MRTIQPTNAYRRDYRRTKSNPRYKNIDYFLNPVLEMLAHDRALPVRNRDHDLSGNWSDCRECHVRPDLLLIYMKVAADELRLVRLGSHSDHFR
jgi:mRNA interferase YafQ